MGAIVLRDRHVSLDVVKPTMATESADDETELPIELADALREAGGLDERPKTLETGFRAVIARLNEADITISAEDMYQATPTRHTVSGGGSVEHVPCVVDALIVAILLDDREVVIQSESPESGETIRFRVTGDEVTVTPRSSVVSFGIGLGESKDPDFRALKDALNDPEGSIPTTCSLINAFPDSDAYERWAEGVSNAAVMELSVERAFAVAQEAVESDVAA